MEAHDEPTGAMATEHAAAAAATATADVPALARPGAPTLVFTTDDPLFPVL